MKQKPKITMISHGPVEEEGEGHFIHANNVAKALSKNADVSVIEYTYYRKQFELQGIKYIHLPINTHHVTSHHQDSLFQRYLSFDPISIIKEFTRTFYYLRKSKEDIVNADYVVLQGCLLVSAFILCKVWRKKVVIDTHWINYDVALKKKLPFFPYHTRRILWYLIEFIIFRLSDLMLIVSEYDYKSAQETYRLPSRKLWVIPQVIDFKNLTYTCIPTDITHLNRPIITFVGALESIQNKFALSFIKDKLASALPRCTFLIIGSENDSRSENVVILSKRKNIQQYLQSSDILISPTDVGSGVKFKIIDFLYARKLIIATPENFEGIFPSGVPRGVISIPISGFIDCLRNTVKQKSYLDTYEQHRKYVLKHHSLEALEQSLIPLCSGELI